jgi:hypothetical protein
MTISIRPKILLTLTVAAMASLVVFTSSANAAQIVTTVNTPSDDDAYAGDASNMDLLHGIVGVQAGAWIAGRDSPWLNNGIHGVGNNSNEIAWASPGGSVTYNLGLGTNGLGFDITEIQSIAAWGSAGFGNQGYTLDVQLKDELSFMPLATVDYNPLPGGNVSTKVNLTDDSGLLASGVEFLRFTHNSVLNSSNGQITYRELDIFGSATAPGGGGNVVPEPASIAIWSFLGICLAGYGYRRRRRNS